MPTRPRNDDIMPPQMDLSQILPYFLMQNIQRRMDAPEQQRQREFRAEESQLSRDFEEKWRVVQQDISSQARQDQIDRQEVQDARYSEDQRRLQEGDAERDFQRMLFEGERQQWTPGTATQKYMDYLAQEDITKVERETFSRLFQIIGLGPDLNASFANFWAGKDPAAVFAAFDTVEEFDGWMNTEIMSNPDAFINPEHHAVMKSAFTMKNGIDHIKKSDWFQGASPEVQSDTLSYWASMQEFGASLSRDFQLSRQQEERLLNVSLSRAQRTAEVQAEAELGARHRYTKPTSVWGLINPTGGGQEFIQGGRKFNPDTGTVETTWDYSNIPAHAREAAEQQRIAVIGGDQAYRNALSTMSGVPDPMAQMTAHLTAGLGVPPVGGTLPGPSASGNFAELPVDTPPVSARNVAPPPPSAFSPLTTATTDTIQVGAPGIAFSGQGNWPRPPDPQDEQPVVSDPFNYAREFTETRANPTPMGRAQMADGILNVLQQTRTDPAAARLHRSLAQQLQIPIPGSGILPYAAMRRELEKLRTGIPAGQTPDALQDLYNTVKEMEYTTYGADPQSEVYKPEVARQRQALEWSQDPRMQALGDEPPASPTEGVDFYRSSVLPEQIGGPWQVDDKRQPWNEQTFQGKGGPLTVTLPPTGIGIESREFRDVPMRHSPISEQAPNARPLAAAHNVALGEYRASPEGKLMMGQEGLLQLAKTLRHDYESGGDVQPLLQELTPEMRSQLNLLRQDLTALPTSEYRGQNAQIAEDIENINYVLSTVPAPTMEAAPYASASNVLGRFPSSMVQGMPDTTPLHLKNKPHGEDVSFHESQQVASGSPPLDLLAPLVQQLFQGGGIGGVTPQTNLMGGLGSTFMAGPPPAMRGHRGYPLGSPLQVGAQVQSHDPRYALRRLMGGRPQQLQVAGASPSGIFDANAPRNLEMGLLSPGAGDKLQQRVGPGRPGTAVQGPVLPQMWPTAAGPTPPGGPIPSSNQFPQLTSPSTLHHDFNKYTGKVRRPPLSVGRNELMPRGRRRARGLMDIDPGL